MDCEGQISAGTAVDNICPSCEGELDTLCVCVCVLAHVCVLCFNFLSLYILPYKGSQEGTHWTRPENSGKTGAWSWRKAAAIGGFPYKPPLILSSPPGTNDPHLTDPHLSLQLPLPTLKPHSQTVTRTGLHDTDNSELLGKPMSFSWS